MAKPATVASLVRQSAKSEQDFQEVLANTLQGDSQPERIVEDLTRLNLPKTMETGEATEISAEASAKVTNFDDEMALYAGFVKFTERHMRKLKWHVSHPDTENVTAVGALYRSLGLVSQLRIARIITLMNARDMLSTHEWGVAREMLNRTYRDFRQATTIVASNFVDALIESRDAATARKAMGPLPPEVDAQIRALTALRDRIEQARLRLAVKPDGYPPVRPPRYFGGDLLDNNSWKHFWGEVTNMADNLHQQVNM